MADHSIQQRLAAVLAADVVGYTRLMEQDTEGTVAAWQDARDNVVEPSVADHSGNVVKLTGDGFLVEFTTVQNAVNCAIAMQQQLASSSLEFRMGINLGDIVDDGKDIHGEGVNIAARLEGLAEPGGICISGDVYNQVRNRVQADFQDMGPQEVKHVSHPVQAYQIKLDGIGANAGDQVVSHQARTMADKPSIAVLPFISMSLDPDQDFFSDGITEDIITALSRLRGFLVIARNTMFSYKGTQPDARTVAGDLGVRYILEGSVRKAGNRVRVTTQLTEASTGNQLWGERYDRNLEDVFAIQDEITTSVVGCLEPELYAAEHARLQRKPPQSLDAWECFVRAMILYSQHSKESSDSVLSLLDQAVEADSGYGPAYGLKAYTLVWRAFQGWEEMASAIERATAAATRAIACDSQDAWAYMARGMVATATRDNAEATNAFGHAIDLSPNFAYAHALLGATHAFGGRPEDAIKCTELAVRLSPRDTFADDFQLYYSFAHFQAKRYVEAASFAEKAIQLRPEHPNSHVMAATSYGLAGDVKKAAEALANVLALVPDFTVSRVKETWPFVHAEDRERLAQGLQKAGLPDN